MKHGTSDQARDLELNTRQMESHVCECGRPLLDHEWDDSGPLGGCPETGCKAFRERGLEARLGALRSCAGCGAAFQASELTEVGDGWLGLKVCAECRPVAEGLMRSPERVERLLDTLSPAEALAVGLELG